MKRNVTLFGDVYWTLEPEGELHREDGPAIEYQCGEKCWFLHGKEYDPISWLLKLHELGLK